jgi:hypothetical protein
LAVLVDGSKRRITCVGYKWVYILDARRRVEPEEIVSIDGI